MNPQCVGSNSMCTEGFDYQIHTHRQAVLCIGNNEMLLLKN